MESVTKGYRQIPKASEICADKKYFDILYAYLQTISEFEGQGKSRTFSKKSINFSALSEKLGLSRQTISTKFKNLEKMGLIQLRDDKTYELIVLEQNIAALIPYETVTLMVDALSERAISTYIYLFNRYYANGNKPYQFTYEQIKKFIGISSTTRSNDDIISNILFALQKIGLIKCKLTSVKQEDNFENIKTIYEIEEVVLKIQTSLEVANC